MTTCKRCGISGLIWKRIITDEYGSWVLMEPDGEQQHSCSFYRDEPDILRVIPISLYDEDEKVIWRQ